MRPHDDKMIVRWRDYDKIILVFNTHNVDSLKKAIIVRLRHGWSAIQYQVQDDTNTTHSPITRFVSCNKNWPRRLPCGKDSWVKWFIRQIDFHLLFWYDLSAIKTYIFMTTITKKPTHCSSIRLATKQNSENLQMMFVFGFRLSRVSYSQLQPHAKKHVYVNNFWSSKDRTKLERIGIRNI